VPEPVVEPEPAVVVPPELETPAPVLAVAAGAELFELSRVFELDCPNDDWPKPDYDCPKVDEYPKLEDCPKLDDCPKAELDAPVAPPVVPPAPGDPNWFPPICTSP
jgi:hypothetical protein